MKVLFPLLTVLILLSGCTNPPLIGEGVYGAEELVIDSFKVQEGKFAILEMEGREFPPLEDAFLCEYDDRVLEGDVLQITLYHPLRQDLVEAMEKISQKRGFIVCQGAVQLPDMPPIQIGGMTLDEARETLQNAYGQSIDELEVFVSYKERVQRKIELMGMVSVPNIPVDGKTRLFEVLSLARVPTNANLFKSYVLRNNMILPVDLDKLVKQGDMSQNIVMHGGDKIYIGEPQASTVMVIGEVVKPSVFEIPNGTVPLSQALARAGGVATTGDKSYIQVIRGNVLNPKIYSLNWEHIVRLRSDSLLLIPGDIIYVAARPITEWNRFVNDVLPTIVGIELISSGAKNVGITLP